MDSQQHGIKEDATCGAGSICGCNIGDKGNNNDTANTISSSINMDSIETEESGTVSSIIRACDTDHWSDVSHQIRTDDLDLAKIPKAFIDRRITLAKNCNVLLL